MESIKNWINSNIDFNYLVKWAISRVLPMSITLYYYICFAFGKDGNYRVALIMLIACEAIFVFIVNKEDCKDKKKNGEFKHDLIVEIKRFFHAIKITCLMILIAFVVGIITYIITKLNNLPVEQNYNQEMLNEYTKMYPFLMLFDTCFIGSIAEEFQFRLCLLHSFKNEKYGAIVSGVMFILIHINGFNPTELLSTLMYGALCLVLTLTYLKNKDIRLNSEVHMLYNIIISILINI